MPGVLFVTWFFLWRVAGEKPFKCDLCDYRSYKKGNVTVHMKTHSDGKEHPYQCQHCNYKARLLTQLQQHENTHTGEKPFACELCDYRASVKASVTRHMVQEHPDALPYVRSPPPRAGYVRIGCSCVCVCVCV